MSRFLTWFLVLTLFMTHGSGCSRMLVRDLENRPALEADIGSHVVIYTTDQEYFEGTLEVVGETEITLARRGVRMNIPVDKIKQLEVREKPDQDQQVFVGITISLLLGLFAIVFAIGNSTGGNS